MSLNPISDEAGQQNPALPRHKLEIMTLLFTDMVGSTRLKEELGTELAVRLIEEHHALIRRSIHEFAGAFEVDNAGDAFFIAFRRVSDAVRFALQMEARLRLWNQPHPQPIADRIGIHVGEVIVEADASTGQVRGVRGLEVDKCARVMSLARPNQILMTRFAFDNAHGILKGNPIEGVGPLRWANHGRYQLKGVVEAVEICEVAESGKVPLEPPPDSEKAWRLDGEDSSFHDGAGAAPWRERWTIGRRFKPRYAFWGALLTAFAGGFALVVPLAWPLTHASYDLAYLFRPPEVPGRAVIVRMDRESHDALQQPWMQPWDRRLHADLILKMQEFKAAAVVFDVLFDRPSSDPAEDAALIAAAKSFAKVAVAGVVNLDLRNSAAVGLKIEGPFLALREVVHWGLVNKAGSDLSIRQPLLGHADKQTLEAVVGQMVNAPQQKVPTGSQWLNYYGPPGTIESYSYSEVLAGHIAPGRFSGKIVFVGAYYDIGYTGGRGLDDFRTPYSRWSGARTPGVEITATAAVNLIRNDWLDRLSPWAELGVILLFGLASGSVLCLLRPLTGAFLAAITSLVVGAVGMTNVWHTHIWFPWLVICVVQIPTALGWSALTLTSTWQAENRRSARALR